MVVKIISSLFWFLNYLLCSTLKYQVENEPPTQALFALWHGHTFPLFYWAKHRKLAIFPVEGWRGEVLDYLAKKYGYKTVRFLESATPLERSKNLEKFITIIKQGYEAAITVDGPPRPLVYHEAKPGILYLSRKTGIPIVPVGIKMNRKISLFWRWDRYEIPLPWSKIKIKFGKPFIATEKTKTQELEKEIHQLSSES